MNVHLVIVHSAVLHFDNSVVEFFEMEILHWVFPFKKKNHCPNSRPAQFWAPPKLVNVWLSPTPFKSIQYFWERIFPFSKSLFIFSIISTSLLMILTDNQMGVSHGRIFGFHSTAKFRSVNQPPQNWVR